MAEAVVLKIHSDNLPKVISLTVAKRDKKSTLLIYSEQILWVNCLINLISYYGV